MFIVNELSDKRRFHNSDFLFVLHPKANLSNCKSKKIEKNDMNDIFFLQSFFVYLLTVNSKRKYREVSIKVELFHQISVVNREITVCGLLN